MTPVWMFEGNRKLDAVGERNLAKRRFAALAAAVRQHEASTRRKLRGRDRPARRCTGGFDKSTANREAERVA